MSFEPSSTVTHAASRPIYNTRLYLRGPEPSSPWKKSGRGSGPFRPLGDERLSRREPPAAN